MYDLDRRAWFSLAGSTEPAWTPDGRFVIQSIGNRPRAGLYGAARGEAGGEGADDNGDLYFMGLGTRQTRRSRLPGTQRGGRFSPDMRFVAYESSETGRSEVIVRDWPTLATRYVISASNATEHNWSRDGKTLLFRRGTEMQSVSLSGAGDRVDVTAPTVLFSGNNRRDESGDQSYDVGADGRFLLLRPQTGGRASVEVVLNWIAEIQRKLDTAK